MSVINQMLRDLDARGQGDGRRRDALAAVGVADAASRPRRAVTVLRWTVVGVMAAVGVAAVVWQSARLRQLELAAASTPDASTPAPTPAPAPAVAAAPESTSVASASGVAEIQGRAVDAAIATLGPTEPARPEPEAPTARVVPPSTPATPTAAASPAVATPMRASIERVDLASHTDPLGDARAALAEGDADSALRSLDAVGRDSAEATALEAAALQQLGRHEEAEQAYRNALRRDPDVGAWWAGLGISLDAMGRGADALAAFREAQRRGPLDPALADYLGERVEALSAGESPR